MEVQTNNIATTNGAHNAMGFNNFKGWRWKPNFSQENYIST